MPTHPERMARDSWCHRPWGGRAGELFGRALFETFARQTIERSVFTLVTTALKGG
ncbi:hypothetical protein SIID45300_01301 [Candidatus Magnetaquicoccaceae bacterium FCR-1]|uniref:Uncharacterized protein n=1 Tax=Candidatus Magnetaquiglobus chichijimensis TaxID=3141448 RepID=A0ABQ0C7W4_9PROT